MFKRYFTLTLSIITFLLLVFTADVLAQTHSSELVSKKTQKVLKKGRKFTKKGKRNKAAKLYAATLEEKDINETDRIFLKKQLANQYLYIGRGIDAVNLMEDVDFVEKRDDRLLRNLIKEAIDREYYSTAINWIERSGTGFGDNSYHDYRVRVITYGFMNRMDDVIRVIQNYANANPKSQLVEKAYLASLETQNRDLVKIANGSVAVMPSEAERSGHCLFSLGIDRHGKVTEILETKCTEPVFESSSARTAMKYLYLPKLVNGAAVPSVDVNAKVTFKLADANGKIIPEYNESSP